MTFVRRQTGALTAALWDTVGDSTGASEACMAMRGVARSPVLSAPAMIEADVASVADRSIGEPKRRVLNPFVAAEGQRLNESTFARALCLESSLDDLAPIGIPRRRVGW
jgi:hypothetical protein